MYLLSSAHCKTLISSSEAKQQTSLSIYNSVTVRHDDHQRRQPAPFTNAYYMPTAHYAADNSHARNAIECDGGILVYDSQEKNVVVFIRAAAA